MNFTEGARIIVNGTNYVGTVVEVRGIMHRVELDDRSGSVWYGASEIAPANQDDECDNQTEWAQHYRVATLAMVDAMAMANGSEAAGEGFSYAYAEALRASDAAFSDIERELAQNMVRNMPEVALNYGIRLKTGR